MTSLAAFLDALDHPRKPEIERLVECIAATDPRLEPGIKWNAPSFSIDGRHMITLRISPRDTLQLIFHRDAKPTAETFTWADPTGLLEMKSHDRGLLEFKGRSVADMEQRVQLLVRAWTEAANDSGRKTSVGDM